MKTKLFGLAAAAAVSLTLLTGCPGEQESTTTTTTTETETAASPAGEAGASPATTAAANVDAKSIYSQKCAGCHGANGGGGMGPALTNIEAKGDEHIRNLIVNGSPAKGMPAFGSQLSEDETSALVSYVKTL